MFPLAVRGYGTFFSPMFTSARSFKAKYLLVQNIRTLLAARGVDDKALATWCGHQPAWLSKILAGDRGIKLSDLDCIADFFGLTVMQLFSPGISALTERRRFARRKTDRRAVGDRRGQQRPLIHPDVPLQVRPRRRKRDDDNET